MSVRLDEQLPATGHVIVIEDDSVVRMLFEETLAELGFSSATFDNAASALTHLLRIKGECILIIADQGLPGGIQGSEFIRLAKEQWPLIPSILTSGYVVEEQLIPPSTIFLHKPYTLNQLEMTIVAVLQQQRPLV
ncbi:Response regulator receiver domain-containing protein [Pseudomonas frederiksbergensis]|uniref:Response regulator receiver domain-containing protein n=1 Tax=Pseudomonas frederiksbergensis TaxID=104087 RepID=A0A1H4YCU8_9PSED|nr:response regulator [Pseudomonas frederiksbergensis]SED15070.1 Response regulator receiver domain-containing protein [Pseudomonas frederiksbergensis]